VQQGVVRRRTLVTRRDCLRAGGLAVLGLGLADVLALRRATATEAVPVAKASACILIWLDGGPSHLETFDPKPAAPAEVRGPLQSISTALPGVALSECLEKTARMMDRVALIRSMTSPLGEHNLGAHYLLSGYQPTAALEYPAFTAMGTHLRTKRDLLPPNIAVPDYRVGGSTYSGSGFLPAAARPFSVGRNPARQGFHVPDLELFRGLERTRLERRREFVRRLDAFSRLLDASPEADSDPVLDQAYRLITSEEAKRAFRLEEEPPETRARYGNRTLGQSCLLARRLVERGVPFVTVTDHGWDTHENLYTRLKEGYTGAERPAGLVPALDLALTALLEDLSQRGLLEETLLVVMGEFGRTPKLNTAGGRDHWPRVFSVAMAGGGVRGGQVVGASDSMGESPRDRPVTPSDLVATIYTLLGIDPALELHTADGRSVRLTPHESRVIAEIIG
jgi:uncharacterized protein (DUF1501 family)